MTISTTINRKEYTGNGVNDTFPYTFWISTETDLKVYVDSVLQTYITDYTVTGADEPTGGNVVFEAGSIPDSGTSVVIWRDVPKTQSTDYVGGEKFSAETHEKALDRLTVITQQLQDDMDRCIKLAKTVTDDPTVEIDELAASRASRFLAFDSSGDLTVNGSVGSYEGKWATSTAYVVGDIVYDGDNGAETYNVYFCTTAHTSGTWATDLSAGKWSLAIDLETVITNAETAQAAAEAAQALAEAAQSAAETAQAAAEAAQTAAETAETNAETAETGAETAQTAAETAQTAAETAQGLAETAQAAAEAAQALAETAQTGAETAETNAETAQTAAEAAQTAAEAAQTAAETAQTAAETAQTAAETAQTAAENAQSYAEEWANKAEDSLISAAAGGDQVDDYSALHWANKSEGFKDDAETAKTAAEAAQSAAETAQGLAETAQTAAEAAQTAAETAETNAETAETNAETAETNAAASAVAAQTYAEGLFGLPGTDHTGEGFKTDDINAGESIALFDLLYLHSDGEWHIADADAEATCNVRAIALEAGTDGNPIEVLTWGFVRDDTWAWTVGATLYASTTAGDMTETAPSGSGDIVQIVGVAVTADIVFFRPDSAYLEIT